MSDQVGGRRGRPRAAHRRPARRARAGHHDRRRLPLLRHAAALVHHRRHPRPRPLHAQHGHGRVHRRPRRRADRRAQRRGRAVAPPRLPVRAARHPPRRLLREQDGPRRLGRGALPRDRGAMRSSSPSSSRCPTRASIPISRAEGRQRRRALRRTPPCVRRAAAARAPRGRSRWPPTATSTTSRLPVQWVDPPARRRRATTARYAGQLVSGVSRAGDEVLVLPEGARTTIERIETPTARSSRRCRRCRSASCSPTTSTSAAAT